MSVSIRAGELRKRVEVQIPFETKDSFGAVTSAWATDSKRWAEVIPATAKEADIADQVTGRVTHKITMRHYPGLSPRHRIKFGTRLFNISGIVNVDEVGVMTIVDAVEVV